MYVVSILTTKVNNKSGWVLVYCPNCDTYYDISLVESMEHPDAPYIMILACLQNHLVCSKREFKSYDELCEICTYFENE